MPVKASAVRLRDAEPSWLFWPWRYAPYLAYQGARYALPSLCCRSCQL